MKSDIDLLDRYTGSPGELLQKFKLGTVSPVLLRKWKILNDEHDPADDAHQACEQQKAHKRATGALTGLMAIVILDVFVIPILCLFYLPHQLISIHWFLVILAVLLLLTGASGILFKQLHSRSKEFDPTAAIRATEFCKLHNAVQISIAAPYVLTVFLESELKYLAEDLLFEKAKEIQEHQSQPLAERDNAWKAEKMVLLHQFGHLFDVFTFADLIVDEGYERFFSKAA